MSLVQNLVDGFNKNNYKLPWGNVKKLEPIEHILNGMYSVINNPIFKNVQIQAFNIGIRKQKIIFALIKLDRIGGTHWYKAEQEGSLRYIIKNWNEWEKVNK